MIFQVDRNGRNLIYCVNCLMQSDMGYLIEVLQAVTVVNGMAVCENHFKAELAGMIRR